MKRLLLVVGLLAAFAAGYGGTQVLAFPGSGVYGRAEFRGYFTNASDSSGWEVLNVSCSASGEYGPYNYNNGNSSCNAIPRDLNSAAEFKAFIDGRIDNGIPNGSYGFSSGTYGDPRAKTGAALIVHTMLNTPAASRGRPPSAAQRTQWRALVDEYSAAGLVSWSINYNSTINSLYQGTDNTPSPDDDAFYDEAKDGLSIVFKNPAGGVEYAIRRECGNPVSTGDPGNVPDFTMTGQTRVNGSTSNISVFPGDTLSFTHHLTNAGPQSTSPTSIAWTVHNMPPSGSGGQMASGSSVRAVGTGTVYTEPTFTVPAGTAEGTQYCRQVRWSPTSATNYGSTSGTTRCATVQGSYNLTPTVTVQINGQTVNGNIAQPGDTITFSYNVNNGDTGTSSSTACTIYGLTRTGHYNIPTPYDTTSDAGYVQPSHGCPRNFVGNTNTSLLATPESVSGASVATNTSICRSLFVNPATPGGTALGDEKCAYVAGRPYARVYGGDVQAGGSFETSPGVCTLNSGASIIGWNKGSAFSYAGSGVQYAAFALGSVLDVATASGTSGGASTPIGLGFANTTNTNLPNGLFGGTFGSAPCIPDYYADRPASTLAFPTTSPVITNMVTGVYGANSGAGNVYLGGGGFVDTGERITVYVDDDVYLNTNVVYSAGWTSATVPLFRLIARGNIYIDLGVTRLDGLYVAQPKTDGTGGTIYTCSTTIGGQQPVLPSTHAATFKSVCDDQKLTVNGSLVGRQVILNRTRNTVSDAVAGETDVASMAAEVFNLSPALWIAQPTSTSGGSASATTVDYDSITSLPPIL